MQRLILGTAATGRLNDGKAVSRLLQECLHEGATAFDTAPLYGSGAMEAFLGQVLRDARARDGVTVNTKFGLSPLVPFKHPERHYFLSKLAQAVGRRLGKKAEKTFSGETVSESAMASLERSVRLLGAGRIDVFFAHEVPVDLLMTPRFLDFIRLAKARGLFRRFGLGGYRSQYPGRASRELMDEVDVIQVESVPGLRPAVPDDWSGEIFLHGVLAPMRGAAGNDLKLTSPQQCFAEGLKVQGASRLVLGISRISNFRKAAEAMQGCLNP
jgi:aryl-alcohol dehydrogenase-like predicted oxidoreductase